MIQSQNNRAIDFDNSCFALVPNFVETGNNPSNQTVYIITAARKIVDHIEDCGIGITEGSMKIKLWVMCNMHSVPLYTFDHNFQNQISLFNKVLFANEKVINNFRLSERCLVLLHPFRFSMATD